MQKKTEFDWSKLPTLWLNAFSRPAETFAQEKENSNYWIAVLNYGLAGAVTTLASGVLSGALLALPGLSGLLITLALVAGVLLSIIGAVIGNGVIFLFAKLLGGKGGFKQLYYLTSLYNVPLSVAYIIPLVGFLALLYGIYLHILAVRESQELSTGRAAVAVLLPVFVLMLLIATIAIALLGTLLAGARR